MPGLGPPAAEKGRERPCVQLQTKDDGCNTRGLLHAAVYGLVAAPISYRQQRPLLINLTFW
jgi:hypothetical protein